MKPKFIPRLLLAMAMSYAYGFLCHCCPPAGEVQPFQGWPWYWVITWFWATGLYFGCSFWNVFTFINAHTSKGA